jgi:PIN domain nuclease of toxin-antitoxin system
MNLLLDTHVFLWVVDDNPSLSREAREAIADGSNVVFVSAATAWEIAIKQTMGKLRVPFGDYPEQLKLNRLAELDITSEHAIAAGRLPVHHRDPFDRMLVAQAQVERLTIVTRDRKIRAYDVRVISA